MKSNFPEFRREIRQSATLAGPVVVSMLAQNSMGFVDTVMVGRLGKEALAGVALGNMVYFFLLILCMGVILAVGPMVSQAFGAGKNEPIGRAVRQGFWMGGLLFVLFFGVIWNAGRIMIALGQDPQTVAMSQAYLRAVAWGFLPFLWFIALRSFVESVSQPWPVTIVAFGGLGLNVVLDYVLMFGKLGFPALGLVGTGYATSIVMWSMCIALALHVRSSKRYRVYGVFSRLGKPDPHYFKELLRIGWPIGASYGIESGLFTATAFLMGLVGQTQLASHQIAIQSAAFTFMVPLGIGIAASVRVGQAVGRRDVEGVRRAALAGVGLAVLFMSISASIFLIAPRAIVSLFLDVSNPINADVYALATALLGIAAVFQVFDGIQVSTAGALRGLKDTRAPMLIGLVSYWGIGLGSSYLLAFRLELGAVGLWWGLVVGLGAASLLLLIRLRRRLRTDVVSTRAIL